MNFRIILTPQESKALVKISERVLLSPGQVASRVISKLSEQDILDIFTRKRRPPQEDSEATK